MCREYLPKKVKLMRYQLHKDYQGVSTNWNVSIIKVSGQMHSDAF